VIEVTDGDTIKAQTQDSKVLAIRIAGIDAPERDQPFGLESQRNLADITLLRAVTLEPQKRDKYGRIVAKVFVDGRDVGLAQVRAGLAWHYKLYESEQAKSDRETYAAEEFEARKRGVGLWANPGAVAPWDFRKQRRAADSRKRYE
jgi:endonuclease YncB( thermonuclease family)